MKIEDYINQNRASLDSNKPDDRLVWEGIRADMHRGSSFMGRNYWKIAVVLMLLIGIPYLLKNETTWLDKPTPLAEFGKDAGAKEANYKKVIQAKFETIDIEKHANDELVTSLLDQLQLLDTIYSMALNDLQTSGYQEKIVNTIFDTYEKRIQVLERIIMETQKPEENENNEIHKIEL